MKKEESAGSWKASFLDEALLLISSVTSARHLTSSGLIYKMGLLN